MAVAPVGGWLTAGGRGGSQSKTVGGLSERQRTELLDMFQQN